MIKYPLENIQRASFDTIRKELKDILHKAPGIYALYNNDKLAYVGLATRLYGRMVGHLRRKKLKWNNFSIFVVKNIKYLRDIETAVVRIAKPKGNKIEGRVPQQNYLKKILKEKIREKRNKLRIKAKKKDREVRGLREEIALVERAIAPK